MGCCWGGIVYTTIGYLCSDSISSNFISILLIAPEGEDRGLYESLLTAHRFEDNLPSKE